MLSRFVVVGFLVTFFTASGCNDEKKVGCSAASDCPTGQLCEGNICVAPRISPPVIDAVSSSDGAIDDVNCHQPNATPSMTCLGSHLTVRGSGLLNASYELELLGDPTVRHTLTAGPGATDSEVNLFFPFGSQAEADAGLAPGEYSLRVMKATGSTQAVISLLRGASLADFTAGDLIDKINSNVDATKILGWAQLDVQADDVIQEINANGTLTIDPSRVGGLREVAGVAALRATPVSAGGLWLSYHSSAGDGGQGSFRGVSGAPAGTYVDNGGTVIVPTGGDGSAAWLRDQVGYVNVRWFGATGDGAVDDAAAIQAAIDSLAVYAAYGASPTRRSQGGGTVILPPGLYAVSQTVTIPQNITLAGAGAEATKLVMTGSGSTVLQPIYQPVTSVVQKKTGINIRDLSIDGGDYTNVGIGSLGSEGLMLSAFTRLVVTRCSVGIRIEGGWLNTFSDIDISDCVVGFFGGGLGSAPGFNANVFRNVTAQRFSRMGFFISGSTNLIDGSTAQFSRYDATAAVPPNCPDHAFPVGIEIFGADTTTLMFGQGRTSQTTITNCYFEGVVDGSNNGRTIYLDSVDSVSGESALRNTVIRNNYFANNTEIGVSVHYAYRTRIEDNTHVGSVVEVELGATAGRTYIFGVGPVNIADSSGGNYEAEFRDGSGAKVVLGRKVSVETQAAASYFLTELDSGKHFFNTAGAATYTLPAIFSASQLGLEYTISLSAAATVTIQPDAADRIMPATAGVAITNTSGAGGDSITLRCVRTANPSQWHIVGSNGTWQ